MDIEQNMIPQANENLASQLWSKYFPYWPVFVVLIGLALASAWGYLHLKVPVYESTATLLINDEKKGLEDSKMSASLDLLTTKKIIENETEVIKSRTLLKDVITEFQLYAPIFEKASWNNLSAYSTSPIKIEVREPENIVEVEKVFFIYNPAVKTVNISGVSYPLNQWLPTPWGTLKFSPTGRALVSIHPLYFALVKPKKIVQQLIEGIDVSVSNKLSSVINLKLKDAVPQRSDNILNALIVAYEKAAVTDKNILAINTLAFLDERLKYVSGGLDSIEKQLQQYKAKKGAIDLTSQGKLFLESVSGNDEKLSNVSVKQAVLKQVEQYVSNNDNRGGLVPSTIGVDDPLLTDLLKQLFDTELKYEKIKSTTGENNPQVISLNDQIKKIKPGILENIHSHQSALEASKSNLRSNNNSYSSLIQALPQQERELVEISREQNIKTSIYNFLLQKREETALSNSSTTPDVRIVDKAESSVEPVGLPDKIIYPIAAMLALVMGIAIITLREIFTSTILFRKEIETITSFPVIGEIGLEKSKSTLVIGEEQSSLIAEEFRLLRTSLHYLGTGQKGKKLLVTSTIPGEGKSFVAINLAMSLAISGKKVILVEFDLSNPTLAKKLGVESAIGVADYLSQSVEVDEAIKNLSDNANLFIMTAGTLPKNPSELILNERTPELMDYLQGRFDYVIIDSAPVGILSDGYVLSRYCDATLYIVRHKHTPKKMLERLQVNNKINELKNLVIIFNGVKVRGFSNKAYGNGYGYGYIYNKKIENKRFS